LQNNDQLSFTMPMESAKERVDGLTEILDKLLPQSD